jgi:hypothetical protein
VYGKEDLSSDKVSSAAHRHLLFVCDRFRNREHFDRDKQLTEEMHEWGLNVRMLSTMWQHKVGLGDVVVCLI